MKLKELAQEAINAFGIDDFILYVHTYSNAMNALQKALQEANLPCDSNAVSEHPIAKLWQIYGSFCWGPPSGKMGHKARSVSYYACQKLACG